MPLLPSVLMFPKLSHQSRKVLCKLSCGHQHCCSLSVNGGNVCQWGLNSLALILKNWNKDVCLIHPLSTWVCCVVFVLTNLGESQSDWASRWRTHTDCVLIDYIQAPFCCTNRLIKHLCEVKSHTSCTMNGLCKTPQVAYLGDGQTHRA